MKQSKKQSFLESTTNTALGFVINFIATFIIFPIMEIDSTFVKNIGVTMFFTAISLLRGYLVRRYFNNK